MRNAYILILSCFILLTSCNSEDRSNQATGVFEAVEVIVSAGNEIVDPSTQTAGIATMVAGSASLLAGLITYLVADPTPDEIAAVTPSLHFGPGCGELRIRF